MEEEDEGIIIAGRQFKKLVALPQWQTFVDGLLAIIEQRKAALEQPLEKLDDVLRVEYAKGLIAGVRLCIGLPETTIQEMQRLQDAAVERGETYDG